MGRGWWVGGATVTGALLGGAVGARELLAAQARAARAVVGKPLGEDAHRADRVWKKSYGDPIDLLVLGDSIAAGLGADGPKGTFGAQLARRLAPKARRSVRLHTAAVVGAESSMLRAQLAGLPAGYRPDVAVIVVGGNDVTHRVKVADSCQHLAEAILALRELDVPVVVGTCPDLGALTVLQQPLRTLARVASRQLASAQRDVAVRHGALAVSLADVVGPFFVTRPDEMFAADRFHPSTAGYKRTAKAVLPSVLAALSLTEELPHGHHPPLSTGATAVVVPTKSRDDRPEGPLHA
ncbi:SGNH/GDSL hydrolase family protein [Nocardioides sp. SYSU DS0663]|uniref:SGNH/GDSL hydrolase family protein n=1 Tax=Nocardioides sp. SYSU DS0663 TaxID=3416445 RepID=UPI003F4B8459